VASRPTHIYSSSLNRRDKRWRTRRRRSFPLGSVTLPGGAMARLLALAAVAAGVVAERLVG
jgi:hypothetical protein